MKINNCPKCGREPVLYADLDYNGWRLQCRYCGLVTECFETRDEAVAKWNEMTKGESK